MRLSIFIGLLYVAWCINPTTFDSLVYKPVDLMLIGFVFFLGLIGDLSELGKGKEKR